MIDSGNQTRLWQAHLHLTQDLVRDYCYSQNLAEDALQEAKLALWEATFEWREDMQEKFAHYAWLCMRRKLLIYLTQTAVDKPLLSRLERQVMQDLRKHLCAGEMITCKLMHLLSEQSGISRFRLSQLIGYWYTTSTALSASALDLMDEEIPSTEESYLFEKQCQALSEGIQALPERERLIITARHLEDPKKTLVELAEQLGLGITRVSQLEAEGMGRLRRHLDAEARKTKTIADEIPTHICNHERFHEALDILSERERLIVTARHLEYPRRTLGELSRILSLGKSRIHQLEIAALQRVESFLLAAPSPEASI